MPHKTRFVAVCMSLVHNLSRFARGLTWHNGARHCSDSKNNITSGRRTKLAARFVTFLSRVRWLAGVPWVPHAWSCAHIPSQQGKASLRTTGGRQKKWTNPNGHVIRFGQVQDVYGGVPAFPEPQNSMLRRCPWTFTNGQKKWTPSCRSCHVSTLNSGVQGGEVVFALGSANCLRLSWWAMVWMQVVHYFCPPPV